MKIHFSGVDWESRSGPNAFAGRLKSQFQSMGHDVVGANEKHDVWLCFIQPSSYPCKGSKTVQRLDGLWFKKDNFHLNAPIKQVYDFVDDVVIQTEFDKKFITKFFGERKNIHVIGNGIYLQGKSFYDEDPDELIFTCSAFWHKQKRLVDNIKLFQKIRQQRTDRECILNILGPNSEQFINHLSNKEKENVKILGNLDHRRCDYEYHSSDWFIHLAFLDHFPNVCVQALAQGCPVIYASDGGGTKEVVKENGIMVQSSKEFDFTLLDYENPEKEGYILDIDNFVLPKRPEIYPDYLSIKLIAEQYLKVFES